jgi:hypothetical protein
MMLDLMVRKDGPSIGADSKHDHVQAMTEAPLIVAKGDYSLKQFIMTRTDPFVYCFFDKRQYRNMKF